MARDTATRRRSPRPAEVIALLLAVPAVALLLRLDPPAPVVSEPEPTVTPSGEWQRLETGSSGAAGAQGIAGVAAVDGALVGVGIDARNAGSGRTGPGVWRSPDGRAWMPVLDATLPDGGVAGAVVMTDVVALPRAARTRLVAVGYRNAEPATAPLAWVSDDGGTTWAYVAVDDAGEIAAVVDAGGRLVAVGRAPARRRAGDEAAVWTSGDGMGWTRRTTPQLGLRSFTDVAAHGPNLVALGDPPSLWHSANGGGLWDRALVPEDASGPGAIAAAADGFLAAAGDVVLRASEGLVWEVAVPGSLGADDSVVAAVAQVGGELLAAGAHGTRATLWRSTAIGPWEEVALDSRGLAHAGVIVDADGDPIVLGAEMLEADQDVAAWAPAAARVTPPARQTGAVAVFATRSSFTTVDLGSGAVRRVDNVAVGNDAVTPLERDGQLVYLCHSTTVCVSQPDRLDAAGGVGEATTVLASAHADRVWLIANVSSLTQAREVTLDGQPTTPAAFLPNLAWPVAAIADGLLLADGSGALPLWRPDEGVLRRVATGQFVTAAADLVITAPTTPQQASTRLVLTGAESSTIDAPAGEAFGGWPTAIDARGRRLATTLVPQNLLGDESLLERPVAIVDLVAGDVERLDWRVDGGTHAFGWSPAGDLLCAAAADDLSCYDARSGTVRRYVVALRGQAFGFAIVDPTPDRNGRRLRGV